MIMVSKGPDELSENDLLSEVELRGFNCTVEPVTCEICIYDIYYATLSAEISEIDNNKKTCIVRHPTF